MFEDVLQKSNILGFISEETSEDGESHKLVFRVLDQKRWNKMLPQIFVQSADEETYGLIVNKQYFWDDEEESVTYCWVLILWGDLEEARDILAPVLSRRAGPPPMPKSVAASAPAARDGGHVIIRSRRTSSDGRRSETVVNLPHRRGKDRNKKKAGTAKIGEGKKGFAQAIGGDAGNAWDDAHREDL